MNIVHCRLPSGLCLVQFSAKKQIPNIKRFTPLGEKVVKPEGKFNLAPDVPPKVISNRAAEEQVGSFGSLRCII